MEDNPGLGMYSSDAETWELELRTWKLISSLLGYEERYLYHHKILTITIK
jgi:hypothetical protein